MVQARWTIYSYPIGVKGLKKKNLQAKNDKNERFRIGDKVWLKPPNAKCHAKWQPAIITQDASNQSVEVKRHSASCETH